jgi:hypothetical protein
MALFSSTPAPAVVTTPTYDDVVNSIKNLAAQLDANSATFAANTAANDAQIAALQAQSASDVAEKAKADDLSAKLKALLPPAPVVPST